MFSVHANVLSCDVCLNFSLVCPTALGLLSLRSLVSVYEDILLRGSSDTNVRESNPEFKTDKSLLLLSSAVG